MAYTKQIWSPDPDGGTPITDAALNHMEDGIEAAASTADAALAQATGGGVVVVIHGSDAAYVRPAVVEPVVWFGTVQPTNMVDGDWYQPGNVMGA